MLTESTITEFLEEKFEQYNTPAFIEEDPVSIPHQFTYSKDVEVAGFLAATIAWGRRASIIQSAERMMSLMGDSPYDFIMSADAAQYQSLGDFVHRTFNGVDLVYFCKSLKNIYTKHDSLEAAFIPTKLEDASSGIERFRNEFFALDHERRTEKHVSNPATGSACKRLNMYLRWMVRVDKRGVDFGIWKNISPSSLLMPLDVHTSRVSRKLGLLERKQDDLKAVKELTTSLRKLDPADPVKFDFALFGLGMYEDF